MNAEHAQDALELVDDIAEDGLLATLTRQASGNYDPTTGAATVTTTTQTAYGIRTNWAKRDIDGTLIKSGDVKIILAASGLTNAPQVDDTITFDGTVYTIKGVYPVSPADVVIVYNLNARV